MKSFFIVRKKNDFVCSIEDSKRKSRSEIYFEKGISPFREAANRSKREIIIKDFGAGSKKLGPKRSIQSIYRTSVAKRKWQRLMFQLIQNINATHILEFGTSLGFSTVYLAKSTSGNVTTIEACPATFTEAKNLLTELNINNVAAVKDTFGIFLEQLVDEKFDFFYLDGHHDGKAVLKYVQKMKNHLTPNAYLLLDDIRWSDSMFKAWQELKSDEYFSDHYDLFRMGVLKTRNNA